MSGLLVWEQIGGYEYRAPVLGGWLVKHEAPILVTNPNGTYGPSLDWLDSRASIAFIPDAEHVWGTQP